MALWPCRLGPGIVGSARAKNGRPDCVVNYAHHGTVHWSEPTSRAGHMLCALCTFPKYDSAMWQQWNPLSCNWYRKNDIQKVGDPFPLHRISLLCLYSNTLRAMRRVKPSATFVHIQTKTPTTPIEGALATWLMRRRCSCVCAHVYVSMCRIPVYNSH